ncbi:class I SAM-dependent methyltransferase [Capsulimonas corticalis]|nr:class I SAM-dependent methyltransferase [Capsulimonas corticalis]
MSDACLAIVKGLPETMNQEQLLALYNKAYSGSYDEKFLMSDTTRSDTAHELKVLARLLEGSPAWLDVACGTGFFLSRFPGVERAGLDLSPDMLRLAREANPGVTFYERSYLDPAPEWRDRWDLVSCMWYAYGYVSSMSELETLAANLALWTAPTGRCFVPLADPRLLSGVNLPFQVQSVLPGEISVTGILWSYTEESGKSVHAHMIAPQVEWMEALFGRYFRTIELETYPAAFPGWGQRRALIASAKRE